MGAEVKRPSTSNSVKVGGLEAGSLSSAADAPEVPAMIEGGPDLDDRETGRNENSEEAERLPRIPSLLTGDWIQMLKDLLPRPPPPPGKLAVSWESSAGDRAARDGRIQMAERPDFGFEFARSMVNRGGCDLIPGDEVFHWIRTAVMVLQKEKKPGVDCGQWHESPDLQAVKRAFRIHDRPSSKSLMQAVLISRDATIEEVAKAMGLDVPVVDAYATLFFNVIGRRKEVAWFRRFASDFSAGKGSTSNGRISEKLAKLNGVATHLTLAQILQAVGCEEDECSASGASLTLLANLVDLDRRQLLSTGGIEVRGLIEAVKTAARIVESEPSELVNIGIGSEYRDILRRNRELISRPRRRRL